jgi:p-cumate 2,3-dioxygenase alpha subunit
VPRLDQYRGLWFACFDVTAVPLVEYLAGAVEYLDLIADQSDAGLEIVSGRQDYAIRANWKLLSRTASTATTRCRRTRPTSTT